MAPGCTGRGAIAGCYGGVPLAIVVCYGWGEGDGQHWGSGPGAIAGCHCSVLWFGGEGNDQFWGSGCGAVAGCHCRVPEGRVMTNFGRVDVVPLLGAILGWHYSVLWLGIFFLFIDDTKIVFCYLGSMLV